MCLHRLLVDITADSLHGLFPISPHPGGCLFYDGHCYLDDIGVFDVVKAVVLFEDATLLQLPVPRRHGTATQQRSTATVVVVVVVVAATVVAAAAGVEETRLTDAQQSQQLRQ